MARCDLKELRLILGIPLVTASENLQTFTSEDVCRVGFFEVVGLPAAGPPTQEVICGDDQNGDTSNTTNDTTDNRTYRSRGRGLDVRCGGR